MEKSEYFLRFQQMCIDILAKSGNCAESQSFFRNATTVPELVSAWKRYWAGLLHEVPELVIDAFRKNYDIYRKDINLAAVYYNEAPPATASVSIVLVGNSDQNWNNLTSMLAINGRHRVYVLGNHDVKVEGACNVFVNADDARVRLYDSCRANLKKGIVWAKDRSVVNGKGHVVCYDATTIKAFGGIVEDYGHQSIDAYNDTVVRTSINKRITLHDKAQIVLL